MGMKFKFQMGMGMKSLKWERICTKRPSPHISTVDDGTVEWLPQWRTDPTWPTRLSVFSL